MDRVADWSNRCVRSLLAQVLIRAIEDLERPSQQNDARDFFDSPHLDWIADALELRPDRIRQRVAEGIDPQILKFARRARKNETGGAMAKRVGDLKSK